MSRHLPGVLGRIIRPRPQRPASVKPTAEADGATELHPLDHDRDGRPGGSLPAGERGLEDLRAQAAARGIKVDRRWGERRLRAELDGTGDA